MIKLTHNFFVVVIVVVVVVVAAVFVRLFLFVCLLGLVWFGLVIGLFGLFPNVFKATPFGLSCNTGTYYFPDLMIC